MSSGFHNAFGECEEDDMYDSSDDESGDARVPNHLKYVRSDYASMTLNEEEVYKQWKETGQLVMPETHERRHKTTWVPMEIYDLLAVYAYAFQPDQDTQTANFRDVVVDAMTEVLGDYDRCHAVCDIVALWSAKIPPGCPMQRMGATVFLFRYGTRLTRGRAGDPLTDMVREAAANLSEERKSREAWLEFWRNDRCRFHEHAGGRCWRAEKDDQAKTRSLL